MDNIHRWEWDKLTTIRLIGGGQIRRSKIDITVDILKVTMNGAKKTQIVYQANLNHNLAKKYIVLLTNQDLIKQQENIFVTTEKGRTYQEMAKRLKLE
ncbi:MAG: winged helix-turn-helix domain-containing protein [Methanosarcinaceae archaeon]|nr:winged helix-turn-helix domain-containing protein [Methanosarcinaceae archaeon]